LRPSFSLSSTSPWTTRRPRLTWVSEGKDFRRLRVTLKAGEVVELLMLAHGEPPSVAASLQRRPDVINGRGARQAVPACETARRAERAATGAMSAIATGGAIRRR